VERPTFKGAPNKGRCIIPGDGFYAWKVIPGRNVKEEQVPRSIRLFAEEVMLAFKNG
jgi:putative SOS response-associated peptidase YedK